MTGSIDQLMLRVRCEAELPEAAAMAEDDVGSAAAPVALAAEAPVAVIGGAVNVPFPADVVVEEELVDDFEAEASWPKPI